jgi:hypothetical protein
MGFEEDGKLLGLLGGHAEHHPRLAPWLLK